MKKILLVFSFFLILISPLVAQTTYLGENKRFKIVLEDSIILEENLQLLGKISDFTVSRKGNLFVVDEQTASIIEYNKGGIQQNIIGRKGRGPFEYVRPTNISIREDTLYIWDSALLRFSAITTTGRPLFELTDFVNAVNNIKKYKNLVVTYNSGSPVGPVITVYDLKKKKIVKEVGQKSKGDVLLMRLKGSGGFSLTDQLFFTYADRPILFRLNLASKKLNLQKYPIKIPDFKVDKVTGSPMKIINSRNRRVLQKYISNNSRMGDIFNLDSFTLVEAQTGTISFDRKIPIEDRNPFKSRKENFVILDKNYKQLDTIIFSNRNFVSSSLKTSSGNKIYLIYIDHSKNKHPYVLTIWKVKSM